LNRWEGKVGNQNFLFHRRKGSCSYLSEKGRLQRKKGKSATKGKKGEQAKTIFIRPRKKEDIYRAAKICGPFSKNQHLLRPRGKKK